MKRGFYTIMTAQFCSSLADNALFVVAVELLRSRGAPEWQAAALVPLAMDEHGVRPDAVQKAHREAHLSALYIQPVIQNPLGITMPLPMVNEVTAVASSSE